MEQKEELLFSILRSTDIIHEFIKAIIWMVVDFLQNYLGAKKYNMNLSNIEGSLRMCNRIERQES